MKRLLILILLLVPAVVLGKTWQVDATHSQLGFSGDYEGMAFQGAFPDFRADIDFDPTQLSHAHFDVHVSLTNVSTRNRERDQVLTGDEFFDVTQSPSAHFSSTSFSRNDEGQVIAHGTLRLHHITRPIDLNVTFTPTADGATLDVTTTVNRLDFNLGTDPDWAGISRQITVQGQLLLH